MKHISGFSMICLVLSIGILIFTLVGCSGNVNVQENEIQSYPIDSNVQTTAQRTIVINTEFSGTISRQDLDQISQYDRFGYGIWSYGPPLHHEKRDDIMPGNYNMDSVSNTTKLLRFFTISDIHITDKEAPNQLIYLQELNPNDAKVTSVYSPVMLYTTFVLDAAVQTINVLHQREPFDFGISLGDVCNSTQYNELRWYLDVIDGKVITPSSGAHAGAGFIDYQTPFKAAGLDANIPMYQALGNHDQFWIGSFPPSTNGLLQSYISDTILAAGDVLANPLNISKPDYYMGTIDGSTPLGNIIKAGPVGNFDTPPRIVADPDRRSLTKIEWMKEFFNSASNPVGHGFSITDAENGFACYSFVPKTNIPIPIKVIALDDTQLHDDSSPDIHGHGFLTQERWEWLKKELADGSAAGQLMIIACHIPIGVQPHGTELEWWINPQPGPGSPQNAVDIQGLIAELQKHPNLLMWISGHRHYNTVKAFVSTDPTHPENGFWQVETSSLRDFPQQFRTFEIYINSDYTISIFVTNVDPAVKEGTPAAVSRKYAVAAQQIIGNNLNPNYPNSDPNLTPDTADPSIHPMSPTVYSYNAQLFKQLSPEMRNKIKGYMTK